METRVVREPRGPKQGKAKVPNDEDDDDDGETLEISSSELNVARRAVQRPWSQAAIRR